MRSRCRICNNKLGIRNHTSRANATTGLCIVCIRTPVEQEQCIGATVKNIRCRLRIYRGSKYCKMHKHMENS